MKPVKIAILSCIHGHAPIYFNLADDPLFELVAISIVADSYRICTEFQDWPDVPIYNSDEDLYEAHPELEAVVIGSENKNHYAQMYEAARRGLHIFTMKVPTMDLLQYENLIRIIDENKVVCQVELELRTYASVKRIRELIESGEIGELQSVGITNYSHNPGWWSPWQVDPDLSYGKKMPLRPHDARFRGGALTDHAHPFDLMRVITGADFDRVYANVTPNIRKGMQTEDMIRIIGKMKNGVVFSIDPSYANTESHVPALENPYHWRTYPNIVEVFMTAVGSKGTIVANLYGKNCYMQVGEDCRYQAAFGPHPMPELFNPQRVDFYRCIREGGIPKENLAMHFNSIQAMVASYDSVYSGQFVKV